MTDHTDHGLCGCGVCAGKISLDALETKEKEMIKKNGFFAHYVTDPNCRYVNYHTHGFRKTWDQDDFQIVVLLPPQLAHSLFWTFADRVRAGEHFKEGDRVDKIIREHPVCLRKAREGGRDVLRIILPDKNGLFPEDAGVDRYFSMQETAELAEPDLFGESVGENN
jgi:hypothetical protein